MTRCVVQQVKCLLAPRWPSQTARATGPHHTPLLPLTSLQPTTGHWGLAVPFVFTHTVPPTLSPPFPAPRSGIPEAEPRWLREPSELTLGRALGPDPGRPHPRLRQPLRLSQPSLGNTPTTCLVLPSPGKEAFLFSFYDQEEEPLGGQGLGLTHHLGPEGSRYLDCWRQNKPISRKPPLIFLVAKGSSLVTPRALGLGSGWAQA